MNFDKRVEEEEGGGTQPSSNPKVGRRFSKNSRYTALRLGARRKIRNKHNFVLERERERFYCCFSFSFGLLFCSASNNREEEVEGAAGRNIGNLFWLVLLGIENRKKSKPEGEIEFGLDFVWKFSSTQLRLEKCSSGRASSSFVDDPICGTRVQTAVARRHRTRNDLQPHLPIGVTEERDNTVSILKI